MDPGYRTPLVDFFRKGGAGREARVLAAQGALPTTPLERLALLVLLSSDADPEIAALADATLRALPTAALLSYLAGDDVPLQMKSFFAARGVVAGPAAPDLPGAAPAANVQVRAPEPAASANDRDDEDDEDDEDDDESASGDGTPAVLANLPIKKKMKLAAKGTKEQRAQLIRDPNRLVASAVLSSPKLTDAEVEAFAKMQNVAEEVLRVIASNRTWLKNYGVVLGLVKNAKTPQAISMQLLQRINERDMKMLAVDRNVPEALRLAARKFMVKGLK